MSFYIRNAIIAFLLALASTQAIAQTANFGANPYSGCAPLWVAFTDSSTGTTSATTYFWEFGNTITSVDSNTSTTYLTPGTYNVKLTITTGSKVSTKTKTIIVYPSPKSQYVASPVSGCPCTVVTFTNTTIPNAPGSYSSEWSFGDGNASLATSPNYQYCIPGTYNVALKTTNSAGCSNTRSDTSKITIHPAPEGGFSASKTTFCKSPDTAYFTSVATKGKAPYTYSWNFGDLGTSTDAHPKHTYTTGTYTVRLIITDANGCKDTIEKVAYIKVDTANSKFSGPSSACVGIAATFINSSTPTPTKTKWYWGDATTSNGPFASHTYYTAGTYTIMMVDSFGTCVDTAKMVFTVHPKPVPDFTYEPIYPCPAPVTINFTNHSTGAASYLWMFGDGKDSTSTLTSPSHTYTWNRAFVVYLIATSSEGCKDTFRVRDRSKPFPMGYPNPYYDSFNSPVIIRVYDNTREIKTDSSSGCIPMVFKVKGIKTIKIEDVPYGEASPLAKRHDHLPSPAPPFWPADPVPDPYPDPFYDPPISLKYPYKFVTYSWDFGDGYYSTDSFPTHTYTIEGQYWVKLTTTTSNGCTFFDSLLVEAGTKPTAAFTASPLEICPKETVTFLNTSVGALECIWDFKDGLILNDTSKTIYHLFKGMDSARVMLLARRYGCEDTTSRLIVIHPPKARPTLRYSCDTPLTVFFRDSSIGATSLRWDFGDGSPTVVDSNPVHAYASEGTYQVRLLAYNSAKGCLDTGFITVNVFDPKATISIPDTTICAGQKVTFTAPAYSSRTEYFWKTNGATKIDTNFFNYTYLDTGRYAVTLYIKDAHECIDSGTRYVIVGKPKMNLSLKPALGCAPLTVAMTDSSTDVKGTSLTNRKWLFGDATTITGAPATTTHTYGPGTFIVTLFTTDDFGCTDSISKTIESRKPTADFISGIDTYACIGQLVTFYNNSIGVNPTYEWDFGDGGKSTDASPEHAYTAVGTYTVRLIVTDETGCKDTLAKPNYIKITKPDAIFTVSDSIAICPPLFVKTDNKSVNAIYYFWHMGNGSTSTVPSPVTPYVDSGVYTLMLVAFNKYGCTDTARKTVRVMGYDGALTYTPLEGCAPLKVDFKSDPINASVMIWDFADGNTESAVNNPTTSHTYTHAGLYMPRLILGDGKGCVGSSMGLDTIRVDDVAGVISYMPRPACEGSEITFNDSSYSMFSVYASSHWTFEDGSTSDLKTPKRLYPKAGSYAVTLLSTSARGCIDTVHQDIVVAPLPNIHVSDTVICLNDTTVLYPAGGKTYTWQPDPTISCTGCNNPKVYPLVPTRYYVSGTDSNGCINVDTVDVGIKIKTELLVASAAEVCAKTPLQLIASGAYHYSWTPPTYLNKSDIPNPIATIDTALTIVYSLIGSEGSCIPDTASVTVTVHPLPVMNAGYDQQMLAGNSVVLNGTGTFAKTYEWYPGESLSCTACYNPVATPIITTTYTLKGVSDFGCIDSDQVLIYVFCDQSQLFIPNTFTPNGDGKNDVFYPHGKGIDKITVFRIYNRWGQLVFERNSMQVNDKEMGWDGTFKGEQLNPDTFVYVVEATCDNGDKISWKGDITIIR